MDKDWLGTFYVDFASMRKVDGYVYFWRLSDFLKPDTYGELSYKIYTQGDCKLFRFKYLSDSYHHHSTDFKGSNTTDFEPLAITSFLIHTK